MIHMNASAPRVRSSRTPVLDGIRIRFAGNSTVNPTTPTHKLGHAKSQK